LSLHQAFDLNKIIKENSFLEPKTQFNEDIQEANLGKRENRALGLL